MLLADTGTLLLVNMYLPKSKYNVKHTKGGELFNEDGSEYIGSFIESFSGEVYKGKKFTNNTTQLQDFRSADSGDVTPLILKNDYIKPTDRDYEIGKFERYFVQDRRTNAIIEANRENYNKFESVNYAVTLKLDWIIKGPVGDINKGPYIYFGATSQNKETVLKGEKTIKGLSQIVNNYRQFVV